MHYYCVIWFPISTDQQLTCRRFRFAQRQDCLPWENDEPSDYGNYQYPDDYYCADSCDRRSCPTGEECELVATSCGAPGVPCPPVAVCSPVAGDPCNGACDEFQVRNVPVLACGTVFGHGAMRIRPAVYLCCRTTSNLGWARWVIANGPLLPLVGTRCGKHV